MLTNNTCDREKDIESGRSTLPCLLGRDRALKLYHAALVVWVCAIVAICAIYFSRGLLVIPFMLLASYPLLKALFANPLIPASRIGAMAQICSVNIALGASTPPQSWRTARRLSFCSQRNAILRHMASQSHESRFTIRKFASSTPRRSAVLPQTTSYPMLSKKGHAVREGFSHLPCNRLLVDERFGKRLRIEKQ